ncbi:DUF7687 domain-containing protein [Streptomyces sp. NRRL F-5065]|uniref:DUF7687 domain-containing protein n=1 Tax=Streptomyces sp. NRRL F-5065 TaxID=1463855 RepID=UPI00131E1EAE|nr:hypothetical protein [Streptomyces sp. NRRL F-5065]
MEREPGFAAARWDDPFWHVVRMLADQSATQRGKYASAIEPQEILSVLRSIGTPAAAGMISYLENHDGVLDRLSAYWSKRRAVSDSLLALMRTEEQAKADYASVSDQVLQSYGVKLEGYHKSSKALVNTVDAIVYRECRKTGVPVDTNPQSRAALVSDEHIWVSPRRLDGAIPDLLNPVALWEIKEYWGKTGGGSKMSDAIYELHLVGLELRMFEDEFNIHVNHYAIIDGKDQWNSRKSDVRRAVDLLYSGILDELVVGREVLTEWPRIVSECSALVPSSGKTPNLGSSPTSLF